MGMYDSIDVILGENEVSPFRCPAGHNLTSFQTKDMDCELESFKVMKGQLYGPIGRDLDPDYGYSIDAQTLLETTTRKYVANPYSGQVLVYTHCPYCAPVVFESPNASFFGEGVAEKQVWCEFEAVFVNGSLVNVVGVKLETRDEIRKGLTGALPDDDRVAKKHIAQYLAKKGR